VSHFEIHFLTLFRRGALGHGGKNMARFRWQRSKKEQPDLPFFNPETFIPETISFCAKSFRELNSNTSRLEEIGMAALEPGAQGALSANPIKHAAHNIDAMGLG
jgi:hypothetical protein